MPDLTNLFILRQEEIEGATNKEYRQYFCGNLQRPQILPFIQMAGLEIGISDYQKNAYDKPHYHIETPDMVYILEGEFHVLILDTKEVFIMKKGDFISIPPKTPYASKARSGTKTLFIKNLKGNDKIEIPLDEKLRLWLEDI